MSAVAAGVLGTYVGVSAALTVGLACLVQEDRPIGDRSIPLFRHIGMAALWPLWTVLLVVFGMQGFVGGLGRFGG